MARLAIVRRQGGRERPVAFPQPPGRIAIERRADAVGNRIDRYALDVERAILIAESRGGQAAGQIVHGELAIEGTGRDRAVTLPRLDEIDVLAIE